LHDSLLARRRSSPSKGHQNMASFSRKLFLGTLCLSISTSALARSAYFSLTGDFATVGDQHDLLFDLTRAVGSTEELRFETFANGGGTNAAGDVIASGGIDSVLELFERIVPVQHGHDDDGSFTVGFDSLLSWSGVAEVDDVPLNPEPLSAGGYRLNLIEYNNDATGPWALDLVGPVDALVLRNHSPSGTSTINTLTAGNGASVSFEGSYELNSGRVFKLRSGASFTIEQYLDIGNGTNGTLLVENLGTTLTTNTVDTTFLDWGGEGGQANVVLRDGARANIQATRIDFADDTNPASAGLLSVESDADLTVNILNVGTGFGAGQITVTGPGSTITQNRASTLTIGASNSSQDDFLNIIDDAMFDSGTGTIAVNRSGGIIVIDGGTFHANGALTVASAPGGPSYGVEVSGEGRIRSRDVTIGTNAANGSVLIDGYPVYDTLWTASGSMTIGSSGLGSGLAKLANGGRLDVSNNLIVAGSMDATGTLSLEGRNHITVGGQLMIGQGGTVEILDSNSTGPDDATITAESIVIDPSGTLDHDYGTIAVDGGQFTMELGTLTIDSAVGSPTLRLENGAQGSVEYNLGITPSGSEGVIRVGENGSGRMEIVDGSHLTSGVGWIGKGSTFPGSGFGSVLIQGAGSKWDITARAEPGSTWLNTLSVGENGAGTLSIRDQGEVIVHAGQTSFGSPFSANYAGQGSPGVGVVDGLGSLLRIDGGAATVPGVLGIGALDPTTGASGSLAVSNGGRVEVNYLLEVNNAGTLRMTGGGSVRTGSFTVLAGGTFNHEDGTLTVDGGTFDPGASNYSLDGATSSDSPIVRLINGASANLSGILAQVGVDNQARFEILSGSSVDLSAAISEVHLGEGMGSYGELVVDGQGSSLTTNNGLILGSGGDGALRILNGGSVSDTSSPGEPIAVQAGSTGLAQIIGTAPDGSPSNWTMNGTISVGVFGVGEMFISGGGQVDTLNGASIAWGSATSDGSSVTVEGSGPLGPSLWDITGSLWVGGQEVSSAGTGNLAVSNGGQVNVSSRFHVWNTGSADIDATSQVEVGTGIGAVGALTVHPGGVLSGDGTVRAAVRNDGGTVEPGNSPGALTIEGSYVQTSSGILNIEIGGTSPVQYDQLHVVSGTAALAGTLNVSLIDPIGGSNLFAPSVGDSFEILTAGELLGTFNSELFPLIPGKVGLRFLMDYDAALDRVLLTVAPYFSADFDEDGDVDPDDLAVWQAGYAIGTSHAQGDADGDGAADGADFLVWQRQNGSTLAGSSSAIPEPASWLGLLIGIMAIHPCRPAGVAAIESWRRTSPDRYLL
jgi:T5SS/PEP-CTERM-associated repeat protein